MSQNIAEPYLCQETHAQGILDGLEIDSDTYEKTLKKLLTEAHADQDAYLLVTAEHLMTLVQPQ